MQIVEPLLGTRAQVHVTANSVSVAESAERQIIAEARRLEGLFTVFDPTSALNNLRRTGETSAPELVQVGKLAAEWQQRSRGAFDPRLQALVDTWDLAEQAGVTPTPQMLSDALAERDLSASAVDNLNAIAKGWIARAAMDVVGIDANSIQASWLNLGGDIVHRGGGSIEVGIEDPHRPYDNVAPLAKVEISNEAIATSGGARRWWTIDGRRFPKVLDPRTGMPVEHVSAATIVAADAAVADVLATIALVTSTDETLSLVSDAGAECLLVHPDRSRTCSSERFVFDEAADVRPS